MELNSVAGVGVSDLQHAARTDRSHSQSRHLSRWTRSAPDPAGSPGAGGAAAARESAGGLLEVLAVSPRNGYFQLGFWTGAGP